MLVEITLGHVFLKILRVLAKIYVEIDTHACEFHTQTCHIHTCRIEKQFLTAKIPYDEF
jgi:hypothetical protein